MLNYKKKYLKYKIKYLELKNQIGGILDCTFLIKNVENAKLLKKKKCTNEHIKMFDIKTLKDAGFNTNELKNAGFTAKQLRDADAKFHAQDLKYSGFTAKELKEAGFTANELFDSKYKSGFEAKDLKDAGFTAKELKDAGFKLKKIYGLFNDDEKVLKNAGFSAEDFIEYFKKTNRDDNLIRKKLKELEFSDDEVKKVEKVF